MKILQILPGLSLGGPTFTTTALARAMQALGHQVQFHTNEGDYSDFPGIDFHPFHIHRLPLNSQFGFSVGAYKNIKKESRDAQIVQSNSMWQFPNFIHEFARRGGDAKSVIMTHGTLASYALSISTWKKKIVLALGQRKALKKADMLIATCYKEYEDIRKFGLTQPVAVIPNGLEIPDLPEVEKKKQVIFLGRIHKVKGVDLLVEAWKKIKAGGRFDDWRLVIAGPTESDYAQGVIAQAQGIESIEFTGEVKEEKNGLLAQSAVYVLPTHTENFGISVGEALACATPVVTTTGAPWRGLVENDCGLWIELSVENLTQALEDMMSRSMDELAHMGQNGREWVGRELAWDEIARRTIRSYEWLLNPAEVEKPDWIYID